MTVSPKTKQLLFGNAALRCAMCQEILEIETETKTGTSLVGEVCHIISPKPNGPRWKPSMSLKQLNDYDNLIILCLKHHKLIDDHPEHYPVEKIKEIKAEHESWVKTELGKLKLVTESNSYRQKQSEFINIFNDSLSEIEWSFGSFPGLAGNQYQVALKSQELKEKLTKLSKIFHKSRIYLPDEMCQEINETIRTLHTALIEIEVSHMNLKGNPDSQMFLEGWNKIEKDVPVLRLSLEKQFRDILSVSEV